nr:hypothetical protein Iba_chr14fCG6200 [Ipomoea batatas]
MRGSQGGGLDVTRGARGGAGQEVGKFREVEDRGFSLDRQGGDVVGPSGHLGAGESAEPDPRLLLGLPDLRYPFPPRPHSHPHGGRHQSAAGDGGGKERGAGAESQALEYDGGVEENGVHSGGFLMDALRLELLGLRPLGLRILRLLLMFLIPSLTPLWLPLTSFHEQKGWKKKDKEAFIYWNV